MSDDWRIRIDVEEEHAEGLLERLGLDLGSEARELADDLKGRRLAVSRDDETIFVYAGSGQEAATARAMVQAEIESAGVEATITGPEQWLPDEERWSGEQRETFEPEEELRAHGHAPWEVRLTTGSPEEAQRLADELAQEGLGVIRRDRYVLVGASTEDEARTLARRLHGDVEGSGELVYEALPPNPFAIFGGLGGSGTPV